MTLARTPPAGLRFRWEAPGDEPAVDALVAAAFGQRAEAELVRGLRQDCPAECAAVVATLPATPGGAERIVGHVFFSPVLLDGRPVPGAMGLAPMAVLPDLQRQGIGLALLQAALDMLHGRGTRWVVLVGHPEFYTLAGFRPGTECGLRCEFPVPDAAFLVRELEPGALEGVTGTVYYHPRFHELE